MKEKMKKNKVCKFIYKLLKILSWIVLISLLVIASCFIYFVFMAKHAEKVGKNYVAPYGLYTVISPSMTPDIKVYDVVVVKEVKDASKIQVGDIVTFVSSDPYLKGTIITHRVVAKYKSTNGKNHYVFTSKGDANQEADSSQVFEENIIGKIIFENQKEDGIKNIE